MQVNLEKSFPLESSPAAAWKVLQDIEAVAGCMPGAEITEKVDDSHYKGQVRVRIGPASATFKGDIEVRGLDAAQRELHLFGKGTDTKGTSTASMELTARVRDAEGGAELVGTSQVTVSGKMASFGGRMMNEVSEQILKQFGAHFADRALAAGDEAGAAEAAERVAAQPRELNGLALFWSVLVGFFKGLFGRGKTGQANH